MRATETEEEEEEEELLDPLNLIPILAVLGGSKQASLKSHPRSMEPVSSVNTSYIFSVK